MGIFKEFLQNADDAGARRFAVCYDGRAHQSTGLFDEALAPWQGPALLCFNDAIFSDSDFESISHVGQSTKAADLSTIGKYGLGFNCAYHFTDVVQFITGDDFVCFDPHGRQLPGGLMGLRCSAAGAALLCHRRSGAADGSEHMRNLADSLKLSTEVGVAVPLDGRGETLPAGRAYCGLPLPIETGLLGMHVNAAFALSSNRRYLWSSGDQSGAGAIKAEWNEHLLSSPLAAAFPQLLLAIPRVLLEQQAAELIRQLWPDAA